MGSGRVISAGDPVALDLDGLPRRDNAGRTIAIKFTRHTSANFVFTLLSRLDPNDDDLWVPAVDAFNADIAGAIPDGDGVVVMPFRLGFDAAEIRVDLDHGVAGGSVTGTVDVALVIGT
jgi:hypothetical protein